jgi:hypothetical protein
MSTATKSRPRGKPQRSLRLGAPVNGVRALLLVVRGKRCGYYVSELPCGIGGRAFRLEPFASEMVEGSDRPCSYDVRVAGRDSSCECMGWLRWGHCKHVDSLATLAEGGAL